MTTLLYMPGTFLFSPTKFISSSPMLVFNNIDPFNSKSTSNSTRLVFRNIYPFNCRLSLVSPCCNSPNTTTLLYRPDTSFPTKSTSSSSRLVFRNI